MPILTWVVVLILLIHTAIVLLFEEHQNGHVESEMTTCQLKLVGSIVKSPKVPSNIVSYSTSRYNNNSLFCWCGDRCPQELCTIYARLAFSYLASSISTTCLVVSYMEVGLNVLNENYLRH